MSQGSNVITVTDFTAGAGGDMFDLNYSGTGVLGSLVGWDGSSNPFGAGFLRLVQNGADTELQWDQNGATGGSVWTTLVVLQNTSVGDFTRENFSPDYPPDGSGIFGTTITGTNGDETLSGTIGDDVITGLGGSDTIVGGNGNDTIDGGDGNDQTTGGFGGDTLTGGLGADTFVYSFASQGIDTITDFEVGIDKLSISASGFGGGLSSGTLAASQFVAAADPLPTLASGQFLYDTGTGALSWDADGTGGGLAIELAVLTGTPMLSSSDFAIM